MSNKEELGAEIGRIGRTWIIQALADQGREMGCILSMLGSY